MTGVLMVLAVAVGDRRLRRAAALPRAAAADGRRRRRRCTTSKRRCWSSRSRSPSRASPARGSSTAAASAAATRIATRFAAIHRTALQQVFRRRGLRAVHRQAADVDLRRGVPALRRPLPARRHAERLGRGSRSAPPACSPASRRGSLHRYAFFVLVGSIACAGVELPPWVMPRCSTSSCICPSRGCCCCSRIPRRPRRRDPLGHVLGDGRPARADGRAVRALRRRRRRACSSRPGCRGFPTGASTTRSASTATTCCWCC